MVSTVKPNANATPRKPIPNAGNAAASTALPQPPKVSQKVPKNSAPARRVMYMLVSPLRKPAPHQSLSRLSSAGRQLSHHKHIPSHIAMLHEAQSVADRSMSVRKPMK